MEQVQNAAPAKYDTCHLHIGRSRRAVAATCSTLAHPNAKLSLYASRVGTSKRSVVTNYIQHFGISRRNVVAVFRIQLFGTSRVVPALCQNHMPELCQNSARLIYQILCQMYDKLHAIIMLESCQKYMPELRRIFARIMSDT